jgi:hypothetical protein
MAPLVLSLKNLSAEFSKRYSRAEKKSATIKLTK